MIDDNSSYKNIKDGKRNLDGIINVYKEAGFTSHDVVAKLRGILRQKKIGHTGTLDPEATGVLPVCCGKATKVCELLTDKDKSYRAVCRLGVETDTQDMTGTVLNECDTASFLLSYFLCPVPSALYLLYFLHFTAGRG